MAFSLKARKKNVEFLFNRLFGPELKFGPRSTKFGQMGVVSYALILLSGEARGGGRGGGGVCFTPSLYFRFPVNKI